MHVLILKILLLRNWCKETLHLKIESKRVDASSFCLSRKSKRHFRPVFFKVGEVPLRLKTPNFWLKLWQVTHKRKLPYIYLFKTYFYSIGLPENLRIFNRTTYKGLTECILMLKKKNLC